MEELDIAKEIIAKSGNNFHSKVVERFRASGWSVSISPYYLDGSTNKAREIDLVAEIAKPYNTFLIKAYVAMYISSFSWNANIFQK